MLDNTLIHTSSTMQDQKAIMGGIQVGKDVTENNSTTYDPGKKEGLIIRDFWKKGTNSIHDMHVGNTDA